MSSKSPYDSLFSWPVPSTWSLEDAATVPLTYTLVIIQRKNYIGINLHRMKLFYFRVITYLTYYFLFKLL